MKVYEFPETSKGIKLMLKRQLNLGGMMAVCAVVLLCGGTAHAGIISYLNQGDFNVATAGGSISTQNFDAVAADAGVGPGDIDGINNPLNSITNAGMLPGLEIDASTNNGGDIAVVGAGFGGIVNNSVFGNYFAADLILTFAGGVEAASVDTLSYGSTSDITVSAFDPSGNFLGTFTAPDAGTSGSFIGFTATGGDLIGSLTLAPGSLTVGTDQVQFGSIGSSTPEPSTLALLGAGIALFGLRKRFRVL
jgi:hypothetical protein